MTTIFGRFDPDPHLAVSAHETWDSLPVGRDEWNRLMERGSTRTVLSRSIRSNPVTASHVAASRAALMARMAIRPRR